MENHVIKIVCEVRGGKNQLKVTPFKKKKTYRYGGSDRKESACNGGHPGSIPGSGRSPEGNGNPLQYSCLENPMDGGAWQVTVQGVEKSQTHHDTYIDTNC